MLGTLFQEMRYISLLTGGNFVPSLQQPKMEVSDDIHSKIILIKELFYNSNALLMS